MSYSQPFVIGHRGAPGYRPEHTESSYRLAFELGADAVEPDLVATRDGVLVVRHENEISETTDVAERPEFRDRRTQKTVDGERLTGWFTEDFTWEELATLRCRERLPKLRPGSVEHDGAEPILRLTDVLCIIDEESARHGREFAVVLELKHAAFFSGIGLDLVPLLLRELEATGWSDREDRVIFESFELGALDRLGAAGASGSRVFLTERIGAPADEPLGEAPRRDYAWYRSDEGLDMLAERVDGISVAKSNLINAPIPGRMAAATDLAQRAHARGLSIFTWTLRPENRFLDLRFHSSLSPADWGDWRAEFDLVLSSGVDGIFVDHPDLGREVVNPP